MKRTMIFAAVAAMAMLSACQKEAVIEQEAQFDELVFTATIVDQATKTTINMDSTDKANRGKIEWVAGDEITITDAASTSVVYVAESSGASVSFKKKEGETGTLASGSTYSATYKAAPSTAQAYTDYYSASNQAKDLYMKAPSTSGTSLTFTAACGLLKLNLTALSTETDKTISKVEITGTPTGGTDTTYTLTCSSEVSISSAADFYIALPAGSYDEMLFYNKSGYLCQKSAKTAMEIVNNKVQPVTLTGIAFNLLPGKFSVNSEGKQVRFSKGNLYWDGSAFKFESTQNAYPTSWSTSYVGHFFWTKTVAASYAESYDDGTNSTDDVPFFAESNKNNWTVDGQSGLYALSPAEYQYLFNSTARSGKYACGVSVTIGSNTIANCVVIAPDACIGDYKFDSSKKSYTAEEWATADAAGLVCLPAAGRRNGSFLSNGGSDGNYWSATPFESRKDGAYDLYFDSSYVYPDYYDFRDYGYSVRLVSSVSK